MMHDRKLFLSLLLVLALAFTGFGAALGEERTELLTNGSFEDLNADGLPAGWTADAYTKQEGYTAFEVSDEGYDGGRSVCIRNFGLNDARFAQTVKVEPESLYCLSGWVKAEGVADAGHGANLSVEGLYVFSDGVYDTAGEWQQVTLYGETGPEQTEVTVFVRLGGYSGESKGTAWFDQVSLQKVDAVPGSGIATLWYEEETPVVQPIDTAEGDEDGAAAFWPWLLVLSALYLLAAFAVLPALRGRQEELAEPKKRRAPAFFVAGLIVAVVSRLVVGSLVSGYQVDVGCFRAWAATMQNLGPTGFYTSGQFCDYPPAYLYVLWLDQGIITLLQKLPVSFMSWFGTLGLGAWSEVSTILTIKLVPILCDAAGAWLIYRAALAVLDRRSAALLGLWTAFNPAFFLNSAAWCQMDSVLCVGLVLVCLLALRRRWTLVMPVYVLCALIKPQALMLGFLGLTAIVMCFIRHKEDRRSMLLGVAWALGLAAVVLIPFSIGQKPGWIIELYGKTLSSYAYATVNTANLYYLFGGNWSAIGSSAHMGLCFTLTALCLGWSGVQLWRNRQKPLWWAEVVLDAAFAVFFVLGGCLHWSWMIVGTGAMALAFAIVLPMYVRGGDLKLLPLLGGVLFLLLYVFGVKMHERYLFPAILFLLLAGVLQKDKRLYWLCVFITCTMFINEGIVLDNSLRLGSTLGHLNSDTVWLADILAVGNVLCALWSVWLAHVHCVEKPEEQPDAHPAAPRFHLLPQLSERPGSVLQEKDRTGLDLRRIDVVLMLSVTLIYSVVALWNLGSIKSPQNAWKSTDATERVIFDLGENYDDFRMLYFAQVSYSDFTVETSADGENWTNYYWAEMAQGQCYRWKYVTHYNNLNDQRSFSSVPVEMQGRYVRLTAQQIGLILDEVIFRTPDQTVLPAQILRWENANAESTLYSDPQNLLDEQDTLDGEPSWYNSTYFDEIYHARTAYEHLHGESTYEWTHPPLGKVLMALSVAIFGMTPFGWRFAGCFAGILMLPVMYLLGKQLTKRRDMGFAAMTLLALDCMHLTQTRIATIDSFPVLFILCAYWFMLRFMQRDLMGGKLSRLLPDLALSGFFIACAIASKWIGLYAAVGLAVLFFWTCARHIRLSWEAQARLQDEGLDDGTRALLKKRADETLGRLLKLCLWCVLFFLVVPVTVYVLSYIPHMAYYGRLSIGEYMEKLIAVQQNMFNYHSTPGLGMDHPYYSPWYEWPLIGKPMWYAMAQYMPDGVSCSIFCFGNPAVWLTGLAGIAATLLVWAKRHIYRLEGTDALLHVQSQSTSVAPAFVLIGLLAQFLPWVLVPRGTYIYHYFASVPFLILGTVLLLYWLSQRFPRIGKTVLWAYLAVCLVCFVGFYPYASGTTVPVEWLDFMKQFLRIYY